MARYIDADIFKKAMIKRFRGVPCLTDYSDHSVNDIPIDDALNLVPTADVVPRSEVERIFAEIEELIVKPNGMWLWQWDLDKLAELKKKYTEGNK